jgi:hypothetical protein
MRSEARADVETFPAIFARLANAISLLSNRGLAICQTQT